MTANERRMAAENAELRQEIGGYVELIRQIGMRCMAACEANAAQVCVCTASQDNHEDAR